MTSEEEIEDLIQVCVQINNINVFKNNLISLFNSIHDKKWTEKIEKSVELSYTKMYLDLAIDRLEYAQQELRKLIKTKGTKKDKELDFIFDLMEDAREL